MRRTHPAKVTVYPRCTASRGELIAAGPILIWLKEMSPAGSTFGFMTKRDQSNETEAKEPKPSRMEESRRIIEEYADDLREIIRKLRKMN